MNNYLVSIDPGSHRTGLCIWKTNSASIFEPEFLRQVSARSKKDNMFQRSVEIVKHIDLITRLRYSPNGFRDATLAMEAPRMRGQAQYALTVIQGALAAWAALQDMQVVTYNQMTLKTTLIDSPPYSKARAHDVVTKIYPEFSGRSEDELDAVFTGMAHLELTKKALDVDGNIEG